MTDWTARVECAFTTAPSDPSPAWTDITAYAESPDGVPVGISRGRPDEFAEVAPGTCTVALVNADGRFTPGNTASPYYPYVKKGRRLRVGVRYLASTPGNFASANQSSVETSVVDWFGAAFGYDTCTVAQSATRAWDGTKSVLVTWPTTAVGSIAFTPVFGLTIGRTYTASQYVWVPTGSPNVAAVVYLVGNGSFTATKDAWVRVSVTFTATATSHFVGVLAATATAGNTCYVDALQVDEGSAVVTYTTAAPPIYWRFDGYVDQWPHVWPGGDEDYAVASVSCSDRLKRLGRIGNLRSVVENEILRADPEAYYTLGDPDGSVSAGNSSIVTQPAMTVAQVGTGGSIEFGAGIGPGTDEMAAPVFTRVDASNGKYLTALMSRAIGGFTAPSVSLRASFLTSTAALQIIASLEDMYGSRTELAIDATGKLRARWVSVLTGAAYTLTSAATVSDGATHDAIVVQSYAAGSVSVTLYLDGVSAGTTSFSSPYQPAASRLNAGGRMSDTPFNGTLSHVAAYNVALTLAQVADQRTAGTTGFYGDSTNARISRLATWAGITDMTLDVGNSTSLVAQATGGQSPFGLMQAVAATESGLLFMDTAGELTFHNRSRRFNVDPLLVLDAEAGDISPDLTFVLDDQFKVNDLTVSRPGGADQRVVNQTSIDDDDYYVDTLEVLTSSDLEAADIGNWRVNQYADAAPRCPQVGIALHEQSSASGFSDIFVDEFVGDAVPYTVLTEDIGLKLRLLNLPANAPATTVDLFAEGYSESIGVATWTIDFNTSPGDGASSIFRLDDPVYSLLDSGNKLAY